MKRTFMMLALLLSALVFSIVPATYAQNNTNVTEGNVTTAEVTTTEGSFFPELAGNETGTGENVTEIPGPEANATDANATSSNLTQVKEQAIPLLDSAEQDIQDVRDLIRGLQEQLAAAQAPAEQIAEDANESATEIVDIVKENITDDQTTIDNVGNVTEDVVEAINGSATGNQSVTPEIVENVSDTAVEIVEEATEQSDNATVTVKVDTAMIRLLTGLVDAQDYTALPEDQRNELKADLAETIADLADNSADKLS